jgi:hypothetical protein
LIRFGVVREDVRGQTANAFRQSGGVHEQARVWGGHGRDGLL